MAHAEKTVYTFWLRGGSIRPKLWHCSGPVRRRLEVADYFRTNSSISSFKQYLSTDLCYYTRPHMWLLACWYFGLESRRRHRSLCVVLWIVKLRFLRVADHSSRGVLPNVVFLSVIVWPRKWGSPGPLPNVALWKKNITSLCLGLMPKKDVLLTGLWFHAV